MTDAERKLWFQLRDRRLNGFKFRRQWTIGPYVADFCCVERMLVVEADGGQHSDKNNRARDAFIATCGYRIVRFWNHDILGNIDGVLRVISDTLRDKEEGPHPNPLPQAGEGA